MIVNIKSMDKCRNGTHSLVRIYSTGNDFEETVVRWCEVCGAIVVDRDCDNRIYPGAVAKMRLPKILK